MRNLFNPAAMTVLLTTFFIAGCEKPMPFDASGTIEATEIIISAEAQGKILELNLEEGDVLKSNALVGKIDSSQLELQRQSMLFEADALKIKTPDVALQIAELERSLEKQEYEAERTTRLIAANSANKKQLDDINAEIAILQRRIAASKSTLQKSVKELDISAKALEARAAELADKIAKSRIINPANGTVLAKYAEAGEYAVYAKPLYKLADMDEVFLRAYFCAAELTQIKLGQSVKVYVDFGSKGGRAYEGKITWISAAAEFTPKGIRTRDERADLVYAVKILIKNDGYLKIGQYAEVDALLSKEALAEASK